MLGTCNTGVGLQSRDRSSGTTVDGLFVVFLMFFCMFFYRGWSGNKNWVFHGGWGDGVGSIN